MFENYDELLSIESLCELLNIGRNTAYRLLSSGEIKAFRIGRNWKIPRDAVQEFICRQSGLGG